VDRLEVLSAPEGVFDSLSSNCQGNLRAAIMGLQMWKNNKSQSNFKIDSLKPIWMGEVSSIVKGILAEQSPTKLKSLRNQFYELLINGVDGSLILNSMVS
jgi:hypothetical protein